MIGGDWVFNHDGLGVGWLDEVFRLGVGWLDEVFRFAVVAGFGARLWLFHPLRFTVCAECLFRVCAW